MAKKVLFIGNSQMSFNDLPGLVRAMSESEPTGRHRLETGQALLGGKGLKGYWEAGEGPGTPRAMIAAGPWDTVVIQEIFNAAEPEFEEYAGRFHDEIRKSGSKPLLLASAQVSEFYNPAHRYPDEFTPLNDMQMAFGRRRGIPVAAAGYAWMKYWGPSPSEAQRLELYAMDRGHPGMKGSYIYACLLYSFLTGQNPQLLPAPAQALTCDTGSSLTAEEIARMRRAAWDQFGQSLCSGDKVQAVLDERVEANLDSLGKGVQGQGGLQETSATFGDGHWQERSAKLYAAAAEVAGALGVK